MVKESKINQVSKISEVLSSNNCIILIRNIGMNVPEFNALRKSLRDNGAGFAIVKNSLARISLKPTGHANIIPNITGPLGMAFSNDPVSLSKAIVSFLKNCGNAELICGSMDESPLSAGEIDSLSKLDSLDEIRAKIIMSISSSSSSIVRLINSVPTNIPRLINTKYSN